MLRRASPPVAILTGAPSDWSTNTVASTCAAMPRASTSTRSHSLSSRTTSRSSAAPASGPAGLGGSGPLAVERGTPAAVPNDVEVHNE